MSEKRLGLTCVIDAHGALLGIVTDGDLRRAMEQIPDFMHLKARELMTEYPKTVEANLSAVDALAFMEKLSITSLLIIDAAGKPIGVLHIHDLLKVGLM